MNKKYVITAMVLIAFLAVTTGIFAFEHAKKTQTKLVALTTPTPTPTALETTPVPTASPSPSPTLKPTPRPTLKPTPVPSVAPTPTPSPIPLSQIADVYMGGQIGYEDGKNHNTGVGEGFAKNVTTQVTDPLYVLDVYLANQGGVAAKKIQVNVSLDGKVLHTATVDQLGPGANNTIFFDGGYPTEPGVTHNVHITLNDNRSFPEYSYDNNTFDFSYVRP